MIDISQPERGASRTALGVAALRALHLIADDEPKILRDPVAARRLDGLEPPRRGAIAAAIVG